MAFIDAMKSTLNNEYNVSVTENGAVGYRTTGKALLDINFAVASLRGMTDEEGGLDDTTPEEDQSIADFLTDDTTNPEGYSE